MNAPACATRTISCVDFSDPALLARIEGFVTEMDGALFHCPAWLSAVEAGTGHKALGFVEEQLGAITGWLPMTKVRSRLFGNRLVSSGFGVGGGVCAGSQESAQRLAGAAQDFALREGFMQVELRGGLLARGDGWEMRDDRHCGFERALEHDEAAQLLAIPRKARAEVRKALASDLKVATGRSHKDRRAHYAVYAASVRNLGTPVFPRRLFEAMLDTFAEQSDILTVFDGDTPLASVLSFYHCGRVMPYWGGGVAAARSKRANELMYFALMNHARSRGARIFDFGRSKTQSGPYRFKKHWGFEARPLEYATWTKPGCAPKELDPRDKTYARKIELWKKLPLPIANTLGPLIARDLA